MNYWNNADGKYADMYDAWVEDVRKWNERHPLKDAKFGGVREYHNPAHPDIAINMPDCMDVADFVEMPVPPSQVSYDADFIDLHVYGKHNVYPIRRDEARTMRDILAWVVSMSEKTWCNPQLVGDFIECACDLASIKIPDYRD